MKRYHRYLKLPLQLYRDRTRIMNDLKEKILSKIGGWKAKVLSHASRTTLIRSVLAAMPQYYMSNFLLPKGWCEDLDKCFKDLWWGYDENKRFHKQVLGSNLPPEA